MLMNKLWKTCKHARTLIKMAFLCSRFDDWWLDAKNSVKQSESGGTFPHKAPGYNRFFRWKNTLYCPGFL
jgi:hypothetical protein